MKSYSIIDISIQTIVGKAFLLEDGTYSINIGDRFCGNFPSFESWDFNGCYRLSEDIKYSTPEINLKKESPYPDIRYPYVDYDWELEEDWDLS